MEPLNNVKGELFKTFRDRPCTSIVTVEVSTAAASPCTLSCPAPFKYQLGVYTYR